MSEFRIEAATLDDAPTIAEFNIALAFETENKSLDPLTVLKGVCAALSDSSKARYFVARQMDEREPFREVVIGQLMVTYEWSDWRNSPIWWVQSVYVCAEHRRRGVFRALLSHVVDLARSEGVSTLRLYVEEQNAVARSTYAALGLAPTGYHVLERVL